MRLTRRHADHLGGVQPWLTDDNTILSGMWPLEPSFTTTSEVRMRSGKGTCVTYSSTLQLDTAIQTTLNDIFIPPRTLPNGIYNYTFTALTNTSFRAAASAIITASTLALALINEGRETCTRLGADACVSSILSTCRARSRRYSSAVHLRRFFVSLTVDTSCSSALM